MWSWITIIKATSRLYFKSHCSLVLKSSSLTRVILSEEAISLDRRGLTLFQNIYCLLPCLCSVIKKILHFSFSKKWNTFIYSFIYLFIYLFIYVVEACLHYFCFSIFQSTLDRYCFTNLSIDEWLMVGCKYL